LTVGEFDGKVKYRVPPDATAEEAAQILWNEKQREDRLRRQKLKVARWIWSEAKDPIALARILAAEGVRVELRNTWLGKAA